MATSTLTYKMGLGDGFFTENIDSGKVPVVLYETVFANADGRMVSADWADYTPAIGMTGISFESSGLGPADPHLFRVYAQVGFAYGLREGLTNPTADPAGTANGFKVSLIDVGRSSYEIESWQSTTSSWKLAPCWRSLDSLDMFFLFTSSNSNTVGIYKYVSGVYTSVASASKTINWGTIYGYKIYVGSDNKFIVYTDTNSAAGIWPPGGEWTKLMEYQDTTAFNATSTKVGFLNYYWLTNYYDRVYQYSVQSI